MTNDGPEYMRHETTVDPVPTVPEAQAPFIAVPVAEVAEPMVAAPVVAAPVVAAPVGATTATAYRRRVAPDAVITALLGIVLLTLGLVAAVRAGFDGTFEEPVVQVAGFSHTAILGLIQAGFGVCLLIAGATASRSATIFVGILLGVTALVGAIQTESFEKSLALEQAHAWWLVTAAVIVVLAALLVPRSTHLGTRVRPLIGGEASRPAAIAWRKREVET